MNDKADKTEVKKLQTQVDQLDQQVQELKTKAARTEAVWPHPVVTHANTQGSNVPGATAAAAFERNIVPQTAAEIEDKKARRNNIIAFQVPEPNSILKDEIVALDKAFILELCQETETFEAADIRETQRLGKKDPNKPRPLKVVFEDEHSKGKLMSNLCFLIVILYFKNLKT